MNWMIASDIHGSALYCAQLLDAYRREKAGRLLLLGDLLYHGPRNGLPDAYAPQKVIALLSACKNEILCVRGNCDTEVDQMVLPFPILADYAILTTADGRAIYATHGHRYNEASLPPLCPGDVLLNGHTHVPKCADHGKYFYLNPGSVSIPKEDSAHGYMIWEDDTFTWKNLVGREIYRLWQVEQ